MATPSPMGDVSGERPRTSVEAVALGPCVAGRVALRLSDGGELQLSVPEPLCGFFHLRARVVLYHGPDRELLGWLLPDQQIGVDLGT